MNILSLAEASLNAGARALVALALMGRSPRWLVRRSRLGANTVDHFLSDDTREPTPRTVKRIAAALGTTTAWLTAGRSPRELSAAEREELHRCARILRRLARGSRVDVRAEPNAERERARRVPRQFATLGAREAYRVRGPSLSGFGVHDGTVVYVKPLATPSAVRNAVGSIVLFQLNGALYLKQLTVSPGRVVVLRSAHTGYDPITIVAGDDWKPLAQVVACVQTFAEPVSALGDL